MSVIPHRERDRRLIALARLCETAAYRVPIAITVLQERTAYNDGWPTRGDEPHVTTSTITSSTMTAAITTLTAREDIAQIYDDIDTFATILHDHLRMLDRIIGTRPTERLEPKLCDCRGRDGAELPWTPGLALAAGNGWSNPACREVASRGPLCDKCAMREYRYREHHGLTQRRDSVFAGDLIYSD